MGLMSKQEALSDDSNFENGSKDGPRLCGIRALFVVILLLRAGEFAMITVA